MPPMRTEDVKSINGIPQFGLGTWQRTGPEGRALIAEAIAMGYRHINTAQSYDTEQHVGAAIRDSGLPRSAFVVTTKIAGVSLAGMHVLSSARANLTPDSDVSATSASHSRVHSSTIARIRKRRPSAGLPLVDACLADPV